MTDIPAERLREVRRALRIIVADPDYGAAALADPKVLSGLLNDLLPNAPRERNLFLATAEANLAGVLFEQVKDGADTAEAIQHAAASLAANTHFDSEVSGWAATEIAVALNLRDISQRPTELPLDDAATASRADHQQALSADATQSAVTAAPPGQDERPPRAPAAEPGAGLDGLAFAAGGSHRTGLSAKPSVLAVLAGTIALLPAHLDLGLWGTDWDLLLRIGPLTATVLAVLSCILMIGGHGDRVRCAAAAAAAISGLDLMVFLYSAHETGIDNVLGLLGGLLLLAGGAVELRSQLVKDRQTASSPGSANA